MKPFKTKDGDSVETGLHNERFITSSLKRYVRHHSGNKYSTDKVSEMGLLINRKVQVMVLHQMVFLSYICCLQGRTIFLLDCVC